MIRLRNSQEVAAIFELVFSLVYSMFHFSYFSQSCRSYKLIENKPKQNVPL